jgi:hypothetical protein
MPARLMTMSVALIALLALSMAPRTLGQEPERGAAPAAEGELRARLAGAWEHVEEPFLMRFMDGRCLRVRDGHQSLFTVSYDVDTARLTSTWPAEPVPGTWTLEDDVLTARYPVGDRVDRFRRLGEVPEDLKLEPFPRGERVPDAAERDALMAEFRERSVTDQRARLALEELESRAQAEGRLGTPEDYQAWRDSPEVREQLDEMTAVDLENTAWLIALVQDVGWPSPERFDHFASTTAFLIVQHSGHLRLMRTALPLIEADARKDPELGQNYALLHDRLQLRLGEPQRFGSQLSRRPDGSLALERLEDPARVDAWRREMGMTSLEAYLGLFESMGHVVERPAGLATPDGRG